jgi:alpha-galactosidase/6-phospho-beta-glucosidase family protein
MNKKQLLAISMFSLLAVCVFGVASVKASENSIIDSFQKRFGITLTEEQKNQIQTQQQEMENKRAEELAKWQSMTLDQWKAQEIERINNTTQEEFDKIKEQKTNMFQGKGGHKGGRPMNMEKPAE